MVPESRIPMLEEMVKGLEANDPYVKTVVKYDAPGGPAVATGLFKSDEVAVLMAFIPAGCEFPQHLHDETEIITVYSGRLVVASLDGEVVLEPGESITYLPGVAHTASADVDTRVVAVTVPGSKGFPDGKR